MNSLPIGINLPEPTVVDLAASASAPSDVLTLTQAIARGDETAFNIFYREYSPRLFRLLMVVTAGDEHLARELHQAVMIRAARKLKIFDTDGELWAWLAQIARNQWRDVLRKRMRESRLLDSLPGPREKSSLPGHFEELLQCMSESERSLVESFYLDDLPQKEIARASGRSVKGIQCALARIRKRLKQSIRNISIL